jgi:hypothetical protein
MLNRPKNRRRCTGVKGNTIRWQFFKVILLSGDVFMLWARRPVKRIGTQIVLLNSVRLLFYEELNGFHAMQLNPIFNVNPHNCDTGLKNLYVGSIYHCHKVFSRLNVVGFQSSFAVVYSDLDIEVKWYLRTGGNLTCRYYIVISTLIAFLSERKIFIKTHIHTDDCHWVLLTVHLNP